jgi:hypothetical protein
VRYIDKINRAVVELAMPKIGRSAAVTELGAKLAQFYADHKAAKAKERRALRDQSRARGMDTQAIAVRRLSGKKGSDPVPLEPAAAVVYETAKRETEAAAKTVDLASDQLGRAIVADKSDWIERMKKEHEVALREYAAALATAKRAAATLSETAPALAWLKEFEIIDEYKPVGKHAALISGRSFPGPESPTVRADFSAVNARSDIRVSRLLSALEHVEFGKVES